MGNLTRCVPGWPTQVRPGCPLATLLDGRRAASSPRVLHGFLGLLVGLARFPNSGTFTRVLCWCVGVCVSHGVGVCWWVGVWGVLRACTPCEHMCRLRPYHFLKPHAPAVSVHMNTILSSGLSSLLRDHVQGEPLIRLGSDEEGFQKLTVHDIDRHLVLPFAANGREPRTVRDVLCLPSRLRTDQRTVTVAHLACEPAPIASEPRSANG